MKMSKLAIFFTYLAHSAFRFFNVIMSTLENDKIKRGKYPGINNTINNLTLNTEIAKDESLSTQYDTKSYIPPI